MVLGIMACHGREWPLLGAEGYGQGECACCGTRMLSPDGLAKPLGAMRVWNVVP